MNTRIKLPLIILVCFIFVNSISAQKDLRKGYIVKNTFDTVFGSIDFRGDIQSSQKCIFYPETYFGSEVYTPGSILLYRFLNGRYYISREIGNDTASRTVFLEYLVNGISNLFYMREADGDHYFIEKDGRLFELTNNKVVINDRESFYEVTTNRYKGILSYLFGETSEMKPIINSVRFERSSLAKLAEDYHNLVCTDRKCISYLKNTRETKIKIGPAVMMELESSKYNAYLAPFRFESLPRFFAGINTKIWLLSINEKLSLSFDVLFGQAFGTGSYTEDIIGGSIDYDVHYKRNIIKTGVNVMYDLPGKKIKPFFGFGPVAEIPFSQSSEFTKTYYDESGNFDYDNDAGEVVEQIFNLKLNACAGLVLKTGNHDLVVSASIGYGRGTYKSGIVQNFHLVWHDWANLISGGLSAAFLF